MQPHAPAPAEPTPVTFGERDTTLPSAPVGPYSVALGPLSSFAATFRFIVRELPLVASLSFLVAVLYLPLGVIPWFTAGLNDVGPSETAFSMGLWIAAVLAITVVSAAAGGGMIHAVDERERGGLSPAPMVAFMEGLRHAGWMLLAYLVLLLTSSIAMLSFVTPVIVTANHGESWGPLVILPAIAGAAVSMGIGTRLVPALAVLVVEDVVLHEALARAWVLTRGRTLRVFGGVLLIFLVYMVLTSMAGTVGMVLMTSIPSDLDLLRIALHALNTMVLAVTLPTVFLFSFSVYAGCVAEDQATVV